MPSYFCHQCNQQRHNIEVLDSNATLTCGTCGSDFVEEMNDGIHQDVSGGGAAAALPANPFDFLLRYRQLSEDDASAGPRQVPRSPNHPLHLERQLFGDLPVFRFGMHGVIDMLDGGALDHMMTHLLSQVDSAGAPPPATRAELARLRTVRMCAEQVASGAQCFVCLDDFKEGDSAERLPCRHHFHGQCIRPWLEKRGTCPVCRKSLSAEDDAEPEDSEPSGATASASSAAAAATAPGRRAMGRRRGSGYLEDDCD